ncbi:hypothetical protein QAD02_013021 [Eretmocerus hayati]|uniref:Uncharacterized protein n=1 Tax=Eretmocerus hayati TaxID=131215 RepID=A0ACC2P1N0_9HYME|nr:hypothetical protein QAD02_013021 [Eretmocerus hayati]
MPRRVQRRRVDPTVPDDMGTRLRQASSQPIQAETHVASQPRQRRTTAAAGHRLAETGAAGPSEHQHQAGIALAPAATAVELELEEGMSEEYLTDEYMEDQRALESNQLPLADSTNFNANSRQNVSSHYGNSYDPSTEAINHSTNILSDTLSNFQMQSTLDDSSNIREVLRRLPEFSGSPSDWLHFKQCVNLLVDPNQ